MTDERAGTSGQTAGGGTGDASPPSDGPAGVYDRGDAVCVIGAGSSGLAAVKNLREHGFGVDCYERETGVGGIWNWRHERSPVYGSAHLISSKPFTQFPDFPMPDSYPDYPHHSQVLSYFGRYVEHFGLREHIWFGSEVVRVAPTEDGRWYVTVRGTGGAGGGPSRMLRYAAVVIANGHNWYPKLPQYPGLSDYRGQVLHASGYAETSQLRGKRVLVIGAGNTGCDIAVEAAQQASQVWHSVRRGYWYAPKYALGRPADQVDDLMLAWRVPLRMRQWIAQRLLRMTVGKLERFGLPKPDHRFYTTHPIVNSQLVYYLGHGDITPVPDVARFERDRVVFTDGSTANPDLVVLATGYLPRFEFLDGEHLNVVDGRPRLHLHMFPPTHQSLAVAGLIQPDSGQFNLVHWQTVAIARWLRARTEAPERAAAFWQQVRSGTDRTWSQVKTVDSTRHWFEVGHQRYLRALERAIHELEGSR